MPRLALALVSLLLIPATAAADEDHGDATLHSSTMFGGPNQDGALVYVRNVTRHTVKLGDRRIVDEGGARLPLSVDTCGSTLPPRQTCTFEADIEPGRAYAASLELRSGDPERVRAQLELRDSFVTGIGPLARDNLR
jgi:hypothetical protein